MTCHIQPEPNLPIADRHSSESKPIKVCSISTKAAKEIITNHPAVSDFIHPVYPTDF